MRSTSALDGTDSHFVLYVYAALAAPIGLFVTLWGDVWIHGDFAGRPFGVDSIVRVAGALIVVAACCAMAFARIADPIDRRRALGWFAAAHAVLLAVALMQRAAIWGPGLGDSITYALFVPTLALSYAWSTADGDPPWWTLHLIAILPRGRQHLDARRLRSQYEEQIRALAAEEERRRLARDLHDSIKQSIFAIQTAAATADLRLGEDARGAGQPLADIRQSAREALIEMDALTEGLRAVALENGGLVEALKNQCETVRFRTDAAVDFAAGSLPGDAAWPPGGHDAIFRIAQEALTNIARHARARRVRVSLGASGKNAALVIEDDGTGFDEAVRSGGAGLANMRARADEIGGTCDITTRPGRGTVVRVTMPCRTIDASEFRRKATWAAAAGFVGLAIAVPLGPRAPWGLLAIPLFECGRYAAAWRRARALAPQVA